MRTVSHADLVGTIISFMIEHLVYLFGSQRYGSHGRETGNKLHVSTPHVRFRFKAGMSSFSLRRAWDVKMSLLWKEITTNPLPPHDVCVTGSVFAQSRVEFPAVAELLPALRAFDPSEVHGNEAGPPRVPSAAQNGSPTSESRQAAERPFRRGKRDRPPFLDG
jgi:hypothetical protein